MRKELYDMRVRTLWMFFILLAIFLSIAPFHKMIYNFLEKESFAVQKYVGKNFIANLKDWKFFIYTQWFGKNFGQLIPIIGLILGFPLFSREFENSTIEFLLVRRTRRDVFSSKFLAATTMLVAIVVFFSFLPWIYSAIFGKTLDLKVCLAFMVHDLTAAFFWMSVSLLFSVVFTEQVKALLSVLGVLGVTTALGFIKPIRFLNTYRYILSADLMRSSIDAMYTISLLIISFTTIFISWKVFEGKDI